MRPEWREGSGARWPLLLLLAGAAGLVRSPAVEHLCARGEELLLSAARCVDPRAWRRPAPVDAPSTETDALADAAIDPRVQDCLQRARAGVLPPREVGWRRDGEFHVVELAESRNGLELPLAGAGALPPGEP